MLLLRTIAAMASATTATRRIQWMPGTTEPKNARVTGSRPLVSGADLASSLSRPVSSSPLSLHRSRVSAAITESAPTARGRMPGRRR